MNKKTDWYKPMAFYQIWIRSFKDGNGDGIGDLKGVYEKLEYIKSLNVDGIWFSPIYPSPKADFGYDISDYTDIDPEYGTLDDFKKVLDKAHLLGLKIIMDLVINHTSDEHKWFKESRKGKDNPYSDYYIWRDKPNNWDSILEGKAWEYDESRGQYYLHLFAKKQPDLNMDNPKVREEVKNILRFWMDLGVDGFREDVINFISKKEGLPDGLPFLPVINGIPYYKDGPHIHEYMREFRGVCEERGCMQVGEGPFTTLPTALKYLYGPEKSLDMMFSFDHMMADCFYTEYLHRPFKLSRYKKALTKWQKGLEGKAWNALYIENHDHPRIISRYGDERYRYESGSSLAASYLFLKGTPFIYQGQEIGMTNIRLKNIENYADVSSKNNFYRFNLKDSLERRLKRIHFSSRDSSRTPMQWTGGKYAGFSTHRPWFFINKNYRDVNVESEEKNEQSLLNFYRKCLKLRKQSRTLLFGSYREYFPADEKIYMYERSFKDVHYLIICSFSKHTADFKLPGGLKGVRMEQVLCNYSGVRAQFTLAPYEARVMRYRKP
ncbi:MAG: alpha-glucosidase [Lachnospiraceae bacterium]|nr:alpha-glucosidase [Lachnospiraceae bacterium]